MSSQSRQPHTHHLLRAAALGTVLGTVLTWASVASAANPAPVRNNISVYDGDWSVLIMTKTGSCDPTYRYGVQIMDGNVIYNGGGPVTMQGRVTPKGAVRVIVQAGSQWADGSGKLTKNQGGGNWKGQGATTTCAGIWYAERRVDQN